MGQGYSIKKLSDPTWDPYMMKALGKDIVPDVAANVPSPKKNRYDEVQQYLDTNAVKVPKSEQANVLRKAKKRASDLATIERGLAVYGDNKDKGQIKAFDRTKPWYIGATDVYAGSAAQVREQVIRDRISNNESSGKYRKKGLFKGIRGKLEKSLDTMAGGDWNPWKGTVTTSRALDKDIQSTLSEKKQLHLVNESLRIADDMRKDQRADASQIRTEQRAHQEGLADKLTSIYDNALKRLEEFNTPPPTADSKKLEEDSDSEYESYYKHNVKPVLATETIATRVGEYTSSNNPDIVATQFIKDAETNAAPYHTRASGKDNHGGQYDFIHNGQHGAWVGKNNIVYDGQSGNPIGQRLPGGAINLGHPTEADLPGNMTMSEYYTRVGAIGNEDFQNKQSKLYRYGGYESPANFSEEYKKIQGKHTNPRRNYESSTKDIQNGLFGPKTVKDDAYWEKQGDRIKLGEIKEYRKWKANKERDEWWANKQKK